MTLPRWGFCARFDTGEIERDQDGVPTGKPVYRYEVDAKAYLNTSTERDMSKDPFVDWVRQGLVVQHPFEINEMRQEIIREFRENYIRSWAFDPANSRDFAQSLEPEGIESVKFFQNSGMYTEPMTSFLKGLRSGRIKHDGNGMLSWMAGNMVSVTQSKASAILIMPDKSNSTDKIDAIVAVIMAYRLASIAPASSRGKLFIT